MYIHIHTHVYFLDWKLIHFSHKHIHTYVFKYLHTCIYINWNLTEKLLETSGKSIVTRASISQSLQLWVKCFSYWEFLWLPHSRQSKIISLFCDQLISKLNYICKVPLWHNVAYIQMWHKSQGRGHLESCVLEGFTAYSKR